MSQIKASLLVFGFVLLFLLREDQPLLAFIVSIEVISLIWTKDE